jgi:hypothetical protein
MRPCSNVERSSGSSLWVSAKRTTLGDFNPSLPRRVLAMSINEQIGTDGHHLPLPWKIVPRIRSHVASCTPGWSPLPLNVALRSRNCPLLFRSAMMRLRPCSTYALTVVLSFAASLLASFKISKSEFRPLGASFKPRTDRSPTWRLCCRRGVQNLS